MNMSHSKKDEKRGIIKSKGSNSSIYSTSSSNSSKSKRIISLKELHDENLPHSQNIKSKSSKQVKTKTVGIERFSERDNHKKRNNNNNNNNDDDDDSTNKSPGLKRSNSFLKRIGISSTKKSDFSKSIGSTSLQSSGSNLSSSSNSVNSGNSSKSSIKQFVIKSLGKSNSKNNKASSINESPPRYAEIQRPLQYRKSPPNNQHDNNNNYEILSHHQSNCDNTSVGNSQITPPRSTSYEDNNQNFHDDQTTTPPSSSSMKMESPLLLATNCKKLGEDIRKKNESSKKKKKKRKSLKITECRKQLMDDNTNEEDCASGIGTDESSLFESSEEGSVQKKLREMVCTYTIYLYAFVLSERV